MERRNPNYFLAMNHVMSLCRAPTFKMRKGNSPRIWVWYDVDVIRRNTYLYCRHNNFSLRDIPNLLETHCICYRLFSTYFPCMFLYFLFYMI